ncbi:MAG: ATP-binding protein [Pseudomonadota bacterium]
MANMTSPLAEAGLAQSIVLDRAGRVVQSHGQFVEGLTQGSNVFERLPVMAGFETVLKDLTQSQGPLLLPGISLPGTPESERLDFSIQSHPNGDNIVLMVSRSAGLTGQAAEHRVQRRKDRYLEEQLARQRARFQYIYENTPVLAFAHDGKGIIRATTNEFRGWLGHAVDPSEWIQQSFPGLAKLSHGVGPDQAARRLSVSISQSRICLVDLVSLRVPDETGDFDFLVVIDDVTKRVAAMNAVKRHRDALEAASSKLHTSNRRLEQFAHVAAHDLLAPLGRVSAFSEIIDLELGGEREPFLEQAISAIRTSSAESVELVNDLLTLAQLSKLKPAHEEIHLEEVFGHLAARLPDGANIKLSCNTPRPVLADLRLFRLIARNLLANSFKFRRPDVALEIAIELMPTQTGGWMLSFEDNGSGFDSQGHDPFAAFARMREHAQEQGIGLGLAMVKDAAQSMGWEPGIASVRGEGTMICFRNVATAL